MALIGCTIRRVDATTWQALDDAGHSPENIFGVEYRSTCVRVHYAFTASKVITTAVTPDESFAASDVRVGASVGLSYLDVSFYMNAYGTTAIDPALMTKAGANVWVDGRFEVVE